MNKKETIEALNTAGIEIPADTTLTAPVLTAIHKKVEAAEKVAELTDANSTLLSTVEELNAELSKQSKRAEGSKPVFTVGKKEYRLRGKSFRMNGKVYTEAGLVEALKDKEKKADAQSVLDRLVEIESETLVEV